MEVSSLPPPKLGPVQILKELTSYGREVKCSRWKSRIANCTIHLADCSRMLASTFTSMVRLDRFTAYLLHAVNNPISTEVFGARGLSRLPSRFI